MNETEKLIADKILKRIDETLDGEQISNYLRFLEAVEIRLNLDSKKS